MVLSMQPPKDLSIQVVQPLWIGGVSLQLRWNVPEATYGKGYWRQEFEDGGQFDEASQLARIGIVQRYAGAHAFRSDFMQSRPDRCPPRASRLLKIEVMKRVTQPLELRANGSLLPCRA